jgi:hypothetical protein
LDTGFSHLLGVETAAHRRLVHVLRVLTAGCALLTVLGACGIPINPPSRPVRRPSRVVVIRSLTGAWTGAAITPDGSTGVTLTLRQTGDYVDGTIEVGGVVRRTAGAGPARIDSQGRFFLTFGEPGDKILVRARIDPGVDRIYAAIDGGGIDTPSVSFGRR